MFTIRIIREKEKWEEFLNKQQEVSYLQNWNTALMYERLGNKVYRLGIIFKNNIKGVCLAIVEKSKRGNFLFIPYGPVLEQKDYNIFDILIDYLKTIAKRENCYFIKISPFWEYNETLKKFFYKKGFINSPLHVLAETTWILDLDKSEAELLAGMRKNTRNLIRRAQREEVIIKKTKEKEALDRFLKLHKKTVEFHKFIPYSNKFFAEHLYSFAQDDQVLIFEAWHNKQLLASAIIMFYLDTASYRHGASTHSKIPAAYLLQWEAIKEAKNRGMKYYNFWGIYDGDNKRHPFWGISLFKKGFGGRKKELIHCQDLPLKLRYWSNFYLFDLYRKYKRGFFNV